MLLDALAIAVTQTLPSRDEKTSPQCGSQTYYERVIFYDELSSMKSAVGCAAVLYELQSLFELQPNWDGDKALPPRHTALKDAITFSYALPKLNIAPKVSISRLGSVAVYWNTSKVFVEVLFQGDEKYSYFAESGAKELFGDDIVVSFSLDERLKTFLQAEL